jgi:hypothetical protein
MEKGAVTLDWIFIHIGISILFQEINQIKTLIIQLKKIQKAQWLGDWQY